MPDMIDTGVGGARAIYARRPAWHKLGQLRENLFTAEEAYEVLVPNKEPVRKVVAGFQYNGQWWPTDEYEAVIRINPDSNLPQVLSYMNPDYGVMQVVDHFRFLDEVVGALNGAHYTAAFFLRNGKQCVMVIETPSIYLDKDGLNQEIKPFIVGRNSYDGSLAFGVKFEDFRPECANMLAAHLRTANVEWTTKHTKDIMGRVEAAKHVLKLHREYHDAWGPIAERMIQTELVNREFDRIVEGLFVEVDPDAGTALELTEKAKDSISELHTIYELSPTCVNINGTVWGGLQAVTEWVDWYQPVRGGRKSSIDEIRFRRQTGIYNPSDMKQRAWDRFADLVGA